MKQNFHVLQLSSYTTPEIKETRNEQWVEYGEENNYFQYLIDRYNGSATNNAIINGIVELTYGKGLDASDSRRKPDEYAKMKSLFNKDCLRKAIADYKMMGQCAFQVIYSKDRKSVVEVYHMPVETLRAEKCNEEGDVEAYYYARDWAKLQENREKPKRIPAFGFSNEGMEILYIRPYRAGFYYYSPVDYQGGLPYAELEEEIANYHINNIKNGFSSTMIVNFNNGVPPSEDEELMVRNDILNKLTGTTNAGRVIVAFNDNKESAATIEAVPISDAANQYQFLSTEATTKLMVAHRVTSPMLLGIKDQTGLGNNADELRTASILFENTIIDPMRENIIDGLDQVLAYNDISLNLYFKTLQPLEFQNDVVMDTATREEETGVKLSANEPEDDYFEAAFSELEALGEVVNQDEWELVDERPVDYEQEEALDKMLQLAYVASAKPYEKSEQDKGLYKVRYSYAPASVSKDSREFCRKMVSADKVYRVEDIRAMRNKKVNKGWGPEGADTYDIWLYKGGGNCHHFWMRKTYFRKRNPDGTFVSAPQSEGQFDTNEKEVSVNTARKAGVPLVKNDPKVAKRPIDMPNEGFLKPRR